MKEQQDRLPNWVYDPRTPPEAVEEKYGRMLKLPEGIRLTGRQPRFESWAREDEPMVICPETISIDVFSRTMDELERMAGIYMRAFNSQNQRLYREAKQASLIWDEEPWTRETAKRQLLDELSQQDSICFVAKAKTPEGNDQLIGFIVARLVDYFDLAEVSGSEDVSGDIFALREGEEDWWRLLLWEDAAVANLADINGNTVRGVGTKLYARMAQAADETGQASIGRTSLGSFAERILPKTGFVEFDPPVQDGKDKQRYWLYRIKKGGQP